MEYLILVLGLVTMAITIYVIWFRYDVLLRSYGLDKPDADLYSFTEFRCWLMTRPAGKRVMQVFYSILFIIVEAGFTLALFGLVASQR